MANMLYNGNTLPSLPVWDKTIRPYAFMYKSTGFVNSVNLYICQTIEYESTTSGYGLVAPAGSLSCYVGINGNVAISDSWSEVKEITTDVKMGSHSYICWANFDVLNEDGTLYLAASEPVPITTFNLHTPSFLKGVEIGKLLKKKRFERGSEPDVPTTAAYCLYNGVKLPNIDTVWTDKETYPYAYLTVFPIGEMILYSLYVSTSKLHVDLYTDGDTHCYSSESGSLVEYGIDSTGEYASSEEWTHMQVRELAAGENLGMASLYKWSSCDIVNSTDNTVYLPASDPVPVYE